MQRNEGGGHFSGPASNKLRGVNWFCSHPDFTLDCAVGGVSSRPARERRGALLLLLLQLLRLEFLQTYKIHPRMDAVLEPDH